MRVYDKKLDLDPEFGAELIPVKDWYEYKNKCIFNGDGSGYWVKDGMESSDEVFGTEQGEATRVAWYSK